MSVERFCRKPLVFARPTDSVAHAARLMLEHHVGAVVVVDEAQHPLGIITDRDITTRIVAQGRDPGATAVSVAMTLKPAVLPRHATIDDASLIMRQRGVRRLPIVDEGKRLAGVVTFDDLNVLFCAELGQLMGAVHENQGP
ncbi:MAG TPA: CBS domain-containing protein [Myxococcales bacterium]|nr:CBS domain-containing protein [Myxococcales bacterium]